MHVQVISGKVTEINPAPAKIISVLSCGLELSQVGKLKEKRPLAWQLNNCKKPELSAIVGIEMEELFS